MALTENFARQLKQEGYSEDEIMDIAGFSVIELNRNTVRKVLNSIAEEDYQLREPLPKDVPKGVKVIRYF